MLMLFVMLALLAANCLAASRAWKKNQNGWLTFHTFVCGWASYGVFVCIMHLVGI